MLEKILHQLKDLPNVTKGIIGLVTTLITFIILFRNNFALGMVIFGAVIIVALVVFCAGIIVAKTDPGTGFRRRESKYKYPQYRSLAMAGMGVLLLVPALLFVVRPSRYYILAALKGTQVVPRADVLIAQFTSPHASKTYEIPNRLKDNLAKELHNHHLDQVKVETLPNPVTSAQEARAAAEQGDSKVVVWGEYDDLGITIKLYTAEPTGSEEETLSLKEVSWTSADGGDSSLSFKVREQLPENTTFLSLFIIGQLYYLNNEYQKGHQAFDAAMTNLPKEIALENESLLHFFTARGLEAEGTPDVARVICEYSKAIELNPRLAAAYNNLGILATKLYIAFNAMPSQEDAPGFEFPEASKPCLEKIGYDSNHDNHPDYFFDKALESLPGSAVIEYNKLAGKWRVGEGAGLTEDEEITKRLTDIIKKDPSIPGAHVMLAVTSFKEKEAEFDEPHYQTAVKEFTVASAFLPRSAELHVNLGKVYQRKGHLGEAKAEYEEALTLATGNAEARLGLADVALRQGQLDAALKQLNSINSARREDRYALRTAAILKSRLQFQKGDTALAIETLRTNVEQVPEPTPLPVPPGTSPENAEYMRDYQFVNDNDTSLSEYLIGLIHSLNSDQAAAASVWKNCDVQDPNSFDDREKQAYKDNDTAALVWTELLTLCRSPEDEHPDVSSWGSTKPCLPQDTLARIGKVFDLVQDRIAHRIYFRREVIWGGLACPYVFTFDAKRNEWQFDTTIIYGLNNKGREGLQARPLSNFNGRLLLREVEPEVSHIDQISVMVIDSVGQSHVLRSHLKTLEAADGEYLIMRRGDEVELSFEGFDRIKGPQRFSIEARGYYDPLGAPADSPYSKLPR